MPGRSGSSWMRSARRSRSAMVVPEGENRTAREGMPREAILTSEILPKRVQPLVVGKGTDLGCAGQGPDNRRLPSDSGSPTGFDARSPSWQGRAGPELFAPLTEEQSFGQRRRNR